MALEAGQGQGVSRGVHFRMMERISSIMEPIERRLAGRCVACAGTGNSRSMIWRGCQASAAPRSPSSSGKKAGPTANILDRLAAGLDVTLATLFAEPERREASPLSRRADQPTWTDPGSGYVRRNLSPTRFPSRLELVEVTLPPRTQVSYNAGSHLSVVGQPVWVMFEPLETRMGDTLHALGTGDCLAMQLDQPVGFSNPSDKSAHYLIALNSTTARERNSI